MIASMATHGPDTDPTKADFVEALLAGCRELDLSLSDDQIDLMWRHFGLVLQINRRMNLTRITSPAEAAVKHYADSLALVPWAREVFSDPIRLLDVGTGAGFPSVPLAICCPSWPILAIDGTQKKATFLAEVIAELGLVNLRAMGVRAHELSALPERFDAVSFRAVDEPPANLREARLLVRSGGHVVCYVTPRTLEGITAPQLKQIQRMGYGEGIRYGYRLYVRGERLDRVLAIWRRV